MNLCPHGHDKDVVGKTMSNGCRECHRIQNRRRRHKVKPRPEYHQLYDAVQRMNDGGGTVPATRLRQLTNKDDAMHQWAAYWGVSKSAGYHAMLRLWRNSRIDIYQADRWCIVLGTHLSIVYPEAYHEAAVIEA